MASDSASESLWNHTCVAVREEPIKPAGLAAARAVFANTDNMWPNGEVCCSLLLISFLIPPPIEAELPFLGPTFWHTFATIHSQTLHRRMGEIRQHHI
jgi:hypothetical protein